MNFEGVRPEPEAVQDLLNNLRGLLTEGEEKRLRELAGEAAEIQGEAFEIVVNAAARRAGDSAQETVNGREAGLYWYAAVAIPAALEELNLVVRPAS